MFHDQTREGNFDAAVGGFCNVDARECLVVFGATVCRLMDAGRHWQSSQVKH